MARKLTCSKCGKSKPRATGDRYCIPCRRAYNAKRTKPASERADAYYWRVTVPRLRLKAEAKTPIPRGKPGVYTPVQMIGEDNEGFNGLVFHRTPDNSRDDWDHDKGGY